MAVLEVKQMVLKDLKQVTQLPRATAKRLPRYYRLFKRLVEENTERTSSKQISEIIGVDSATIRRDFSLFGELGRRGYGYDTKELRDFFGQLLGNETDTNIVLIGIGNLGRALLNYPFHKRNKIHITQAYDVAGNPLVGTRTESGIPIYNITDLKKNLTTTDIKTAILSVNTESAQEVAELLVDAGIKGILNFTPFRLSLPSDVTIQTIDLTKELQTLIFFMNHPASD